MSSPRASHVWQELHECAHVVVRARVSVACQTLEKHCSDRVNGMPEDVPVNHI